LKTLFRIEQKFLTGKNKVFWYLLFLPLLSVQISIAAQNFNIKHMTLDIVHHYNTLSSIYQVCNRYVWHIAMNGLFNYHNFGFALYESGNSGNNSVIVI